MTTVIAVVGATVAYLWLTPFGLRGVEVSHATCKDSDSIETTSRAHWAGQLYRVRLEQPENCASAVHDVAVQRLGGHLFVRTSFSSPSGMYTACHCQHRTNLNVPDLPRQDYSIHVYSWP